MPLVMKHPFPSLSANNFISQGSAGQVFAITANVCFKCPNLYVPGNLTPDEKNEMEQNVENVENEKKIYHLLNLHPHPNLLYGILCVPEGIFMPRLEMHLAARLASPSSVDLDRQELWIRQLVSAAAWLEKLGLAHGDLRPENILLDKGDNIRIADFDATVVIGSELRLATLPFCKVDKNFEPPLAGPETEQFSLGSCIYNIRFGHAPFSNLGLESPVWRKMLVCREFPSTSDDSYGPIIQGCWNGTFPSISALETEIAKFRTASPVPQTRSVRHRLWYLRAECHEYVSRQGLLLGGSIAEKLRLRCRLVVWIVIRAGLALFYDGD